MIEKVYYSTQEVSDMLDVPVSTLRYWENEFPQLRPDRTPGGRRRYTQKDIDVVKQIMHLLGIQKLHIKGAQRRLADKRDDTVKRQQLTERLNNLRQELIDLRNTLR